MLVHEVFIDVPRGVLSACSATVHVRRYAPFLLSSLFFLLIFACILYSALGSMKGSFATWSQSV